MSTPAPGRRSATRTSRVNVTTVLAVILPVLCAGALFLVIPPEAADTSAAPARTALTRATVVCPSGESDIAVATGAEDVQGPVRVGQDEAEVVSGRVTTVAAGADPVTVDGEDATAPGLVAARFGPGAAATCVAPAATSWFSGVGAGAGHRSVLELTNPDAGTAVADVTVYGRNGIVEAPRLRGISVPGRSSLELDLATLVPRRDELSLEVVAARGRIGANLVDRIEPIGRGETVTDWLPAQAEPATDNLLLGLAPGDGARRTLVVTNGGPDEVRATVRVVAQESVFTPEDVPDLRIPPQSTARLTVSGALAEVLADGALGLLVSANEPVSASLRTYSADDLSHAVPDPAVGGSATLLLPEGDKQLLLAGATSAGTVEVVARAAGGRQLTTRSVDVAPGQGVIVRLPAATALVTVTPTRARVSGAVVVSEGGTAVLPLVEAATNGLVPAVRPGLP